MSDVTLNDDVAGAERTALPASELLGFGRRAEPPVDLSFARHDPDGQEDAALRSASMIVGLTCVLLAIIVTAAHIFQIGCITGGRVGQILMLACVR